MQKFIPYDSYDKECKSPFGAVSEGTRVHFSVKMPRNMRCTGVTLVIREEFSGEETYNSLYWRATDGVTEWWECDFAPEKAGLYWYYFEYGVSWGTGRIYLDRAGKGCFSGSRDCWQLTVYDKNFKTPEWLHGGVIYQIFPDRFFFSGKKKQNVPSDRILRSDRENLPEWRPNSEGKILNNDYFCGDIKGIEEKLPYIKSLGVTCIYLNPIFEAQSNHRYDTSDYMKIDPLLGNEEDFVSLCAKAKKSGIAVIFDGVFSHTGADSIYFNKYGRYGEGGAYRDENSPYAKWYHFGKTHDDYAGWWGIDTLPEVDENEPSYTEFITGENGVVEKWLSLGASGIRLDVADELPDEFIGNIRSAADRVRDDAYVLGEVWEDATNKISWGVRRRYLLGSQLDSVMNYPFRDAVIAFVKGHDAELFAERIMGIVENYPAPALNAAMNHIGTHDTERIITALSDIDLSGLDRERQSKLKLSEQQLAAAKQRFRAAALLQYTLPGVPSLYYGDEAGMQGAKDPFNRGFYPWGNADKELINYFRELGSLRREHSVFREGEFRFLSATMQCAAYLRIDESERIAVISNMNGEDIDYYINYPNGGTVPLIGCSSNGSTVTVKAFTTAAVKLL